MPNNQELRKITGISRGAILEKGRDVVADRKQVQADHEGWRGKAEVDLKAFEGAQTTLADYIKSQKNLQNLHIKLSNEAAAIDTKNQMELIENPAASFTDLSELSEIANRPARFVGRALSTLVSDVMQRQSVEVARCKWKLAEARTQVALYEAAFVAGEFISFAEPLAEAMGASPIEAPGLVGTTTDRLCISNPILPEKTATSP